MGVMSYDIRPSKAVTRRIIIETLRRLAPVVPIRDYQYVGFGALEFVDFDMMHRLLGITKMTSIESNTSAIERYEWNRPFNGITVLPGRASTILPGLDWSQPSVVWLDYTATLTTEILGDVETLARALIPGSVLIVTLNAHPAKLGERRVALEQAMTAEKVPIGVTEPRLGGWGTAEVQYKVLTAALEAALGARADSASWRQFLNINYEDRAKMQIVGGVISAPSLERALDGCYFGDLDEARSEEEALAVHVPLLTMRERDWLNQRLPPAPDEDYPILPGVPDRDLKDYCSVYRWL